jgi:hypothetical protein
MKDAFGGILNFVFLIFMLVFVEGVLGFIFSYTKAFQMKNIVISAFERYEASGCTKSGSACMNKIQASAESIGYSANSALNCDKSSGFENAGNLNLFCYKATLSSNRDGSHYATNQVYSYTITTQVNLNIPIINNILGLSFFQVSGDTRKIQITQ